MESLASMLSYLVACSSLLGAPTGAQDATVSAGEETDPHAWRPAGERVGHVFPHLTVRAPGVGSDSETGIGALIPWADRLWAVGYVAHVRGSGIGLYEIRDDFSWRLHPESVTGTFANRLVHWESGQVFLGPHAIDPDGNVRTIEALAKHRLTATARHLTAPEEKVYFLTMEGKLFEVAVTSLEATLLADLNEELDLPAGAQPHYKSAFTAQGRLVVANNTYDEHEYLGTRHAGRLAEWDGEGEWNILERNPFIEVSGKQNPRAGATYGNPLYAVGWDERSVIFRVLAGGEWKRYRLPRGSHSWSHTWNTEWMRIREVQTERYLMDAFGIFYDLPALVYGGEVWGIRPLASHLRIVPDFVHWRGMLVLAGDQTDNAVGQPQSGLWFGDVDELKGWGKPAGWGAVWRHDEVAKDEVSDPFLMTGFDDKVLHLANESREGMFVTVEVDFLGDGSWHVYGGFDLAPGEYVHHEFPAAYSAHWVRLRAGTAGKVTAQFFYD